MTVLTDWPTSVGVPGGGGGGGSPGGCVVVGGDAAEYHCDLYIDTGAETETGSGTGDEGDPGKQERLKDKRVGEWAGEALKHRASAGGDMKSNVKKKAEAGKGELGPAGGTGKYSSWPFMAIFEYSCDCNAKASLSWYATKGNAGSGPAAEREFQEDPPGGGMRSHMDKMTIAKGKQPGISAGPSTGTPGSTARPEYCYIMAVDTPADLGDQYAWGDGGWLVIGTVTWTCGDCGQTHESTCERAMTFNGRFGKGKGARGGSTGHVKKLGEEQLGKFKETKKAPSPHPQENKHDNPH